MKININRVEADEEIDEGVFLGFGYVREKGRSKGLSGREWSTDRDVEGKSLCVNITDVDTTLVCEQDSISLTQGVDADIVFCV